jgi:hypothetical protein
MKKREKAKPRPRNSWCAFVLPIIGKKMKISSGIATYETIKRSVPSAESKKRIATCFSALLAAIGSSSVLR